jgi:hypothetical protein
MQERAHDEQLPVLPVHRVDVRLADARGLFFPVVEDDAALDVF